MKHLRIQVVILIGWLITFYSVERLFGFIQVSEIAYAVMLGMAVIFTAVHSFKNPVVGGAVCACAGVVDPQSPVRGL